MSADPHTPTLAQIVRRAVEVCEDGSSDHLDELRQKFEDADEPIATVADVEQRLNDALGPPALDDDHAAVTMARAVIVYIAQRCDELGQDPVELLVLASRAEFAGHPPEHVARWLELQGIAV